MSWRCLLGHDWDGHTDPNYPAPHCRRCDKVYRPPGLLAEVLCFVVSVILLFVVGAIVALGIR